MCDSAGDEAPNSTCDRGEATGAGKYWWYQLVFKQQDWPFRTNRWVLAACSLMELMVLRLRSVPDKRSLYPGGYY